jgi:hypothetical protein
MTILEQECMADKMTPAYVPVTNGRYAVGLIDSTTPLTLYIFDDLQGVPKDLPWFAGISGTPPLASSELHKFKVVHARAPVRYMALSDGNVAPGFYDPGFRIFFRWWEQVRTPEEMHFNPSSDPISPEVDKLRISTLLEIPMPPDPEEQ